MTELVLDDFAHDRSTAPAWSTFTDQVMGGVSQGTTTFEQVHDRPALRLRGIVSLERNGGFIQMARPLGGVHSAERDTRSYRGVAVTVCGTPGGYFIHLRSADTRAPWQYYSAPLPVTTSWTEVRLDWTEFAPTALRTALDPSRLSRLGIVAGFRAFSADIAVARLSLIG